MRIRVARSRFALAGIAMVAALTLGASAAQAEVVDRGPLPGVDCSDPQFDAIDTTCLLPVLGPYSTPKAVTSIAIGAPLGSSDVLVARPAPEHAGSWNTSRPQLTNANVRARWKPRTGTAADGYLIDTAIALAPGDVLVVVDPPVAAGGSVTDLELANLGGSVHDASPTLNSGRPVAIQPLGRYTVEPDADQDGWGDETEDLCPGERIDACNPGGLKVAVDGPDYVPALDPVVVNWHVTNTSDGGYPVFLNISAQTKVDSITGPPGMTCAPGYTGNPTETFVPSAQRSPLIFSPYRDGWVVPTNTNGARYGLPATGTLTCRLPNIRTGETLSGTLGGTGMDAPEVGGQGFRVQAVAPFAYSGGASGSPADAGAYKLVIHKDSGKPVHAWAPNSVKAIGMASSPGTLTVQARCYGPKPSMSCPVTGELRAVIGGKKLATISTPVAIPFGKDATLPFTFTSKGLKWLAAHPRTKSLQAVLTTSFARELPTTSSTRITVPRSKSFKRQLARLARRSAKH